MNKIRINREKCINCGFCEAACPEVFEIKDGRSDVKNNADFKGFAAKIKEAIDTCPTLAIENYEE